jgi:TonB-dependent starch-binding outer membrane protein SusC
MRRLLFLLMLVLPGLFVFAQQKIITGTVTGKSDKVPLAGATIQSKNKTVVTDVSGKFSIEASVGDNLTFTFVGMKTVTIKITSSDQNLVVEMEEGIKEGEQVVVVGYSSQRKKDLTGAVAVVDLVPVKNNTSGNIMQALQGRVAGLYIEKDGSPNGSNGRILIRGANTLGDNNPLYIIDGIATTRPEVFQNMDPATVASVQVLKDASAASIYGARASNGVIIVTTKNGGNTDGKVKIQFNSIVSAQSEKSMRFKMLSSLDRGRALWQASVNDGQNPADYGEIYTFDWNNNYANPVLNGVTLKPFVGGDPNTPAGNTDWQSVMYKTGIVTNNSLTASVGNKNSSVEINLGYLKNTGMLRYTGYERMSGSINAITRAFDNKVTFGVNLRIANSNETLTARDLGGASTTFLAVTLAPTIPVYQKDGTTYAGELGAGYSDRNNPLHMQYLARWNNANRLSTLGNIYAEIQPIKNLFFKTNIGADNAYYSNKIISPTFVEGALARTTNSLSFDRNHWLGITWSNTLRYSWDLNEKNSFKFLAGIEYLKRHIDFDFTKKEGFALQTEEYFTLNAATGNTTASGGSTGHQLFSQFARVDYSFSDKYLAAVTIRRDGSSRFGANNQYGIFPAVSIGWRIDKEGFMQNNNLFSELKVRAGFGRVGNQEALNDETKSILFATRYGTTQAQLTGGFFEQYYNVGTAYSLSGANTGTLPSGFVQTQAGNPNLKWETTEEINIGLDFTLYHNKISGSFDYFSRNTTGILITPKVAAVLGEGQQKTVNGASKSNKGWEFVIGYQGQKRGDFNYDVKLNFAHFRDKITDLPEVVRPNYAGNLVNTILGHSQFDIFGFKTNGLFQSAAEVAAAPAQVGAGPGRIRYVDINKDNVINDLDRTWIGSTLPKLEYGMRVDLTYKNFDLSLFGSGVAGRTGFDVYTVFNNLMKSRENVGPGVFNGWTPTNTNTTVPALTLKDNNNEGRTSDYFFVSTSYFKMRNMQLGYNLFPKSVFSSLRFFVMAENLFWFKSKNYLSPDPERIDLDPVPIPKTFTFGVNASF